MSTKKIPVLIYLPDDLIKQATKKAESRGQSRTAYIAGLVYDDLNKDKKKAG